MLNLRARERYRAGVLNDEALEGVVKEKVLCGLRVSEEGVEDTRRLEDAGLRPG